MGNTLMTVLGIGFIFIMTAAGSAVVYFFKKDVSEKANTLFMGFASGIMIAASVWSLLVPAIEEAASAGYGKWSFAPAAVGFILGGLVLVVIDKIVPHIHRAGLEEGPPSRMTKSAKMFLAVMIHNIPEGLSVGFAFGVAAANGDASSFVSALGLALGIGIQNFPEGAAVALPIKSVTGSGNKAFICGAASGAVEPLFAVAGYFLAAHISALQPWLLAFGAGAMIFVVAEDLIPDAKLAEHPHLGTWGVMAGFVIMMILDVALG